MQLLIPILFATETGTTELVADEIVDAYGNDARVRFEAIRMDRTNPGIFAPERIYLLITSSTLQAREAPLNRVRYGILGFGDRHYAATFGGGPRTLDLLMQQAGARRIGDLAQHDRQSGIYPEVFAFDWIRGWLTLLEDNQ
jgi:sulfite reductase alpha subunit-like flavoprotein